MPNIIRFGGSQKKLNLTATAEDVLFGKTFSVDGKTIISGRMSNWGSITRTAYADKVTTIPEGYHDGTGTVTGESLKRQTIGTVYPQYMLEGCSAWANGVRVEGTMVHNPIENISLPVNGSYKIEEGYHEGIARVSQNLTLKYTAMYTPTTTNQEIPADVYLKGAQIIKGDANLIASNIKKGVTIFGVTGTYNG